MWMGIPGHVSYSESLNKSDFLSSGPYQGGGEGHLPWTLLYGGCKLTDLELTFHKSEFWPIIGQMDFYRGTKETHFQICPECKMKKNYNTALGLVLSTNSQKESSEF